ncbi:CS domain protein, partial [Teladorsagia circumcincta]
MWFLSRKQQKSKGRRRKKRRNSQRNERPKKPKKKKSSRHCSGEKRVVADDKENADEKKVDDKKPSGSGDDDDEGTGLMPNSGNGADLENYQWTQTLQEVEVRIPFKVGFPLKSRDVEVKIEKHHIRVALKGHPPIIDGALHAEIKADSSAWVLEDKKTVMITFEK